MLTKIINGEHIEMTPEEVVEFETSRIRPPLTLEQTKSKLDKAVEVHLDAGAQGLGYKDMERATTYASSTHPKFGKEGKALVEWRSAVWDDCYTILADVEAQVRSVPTEAELLAELPALQPFLTAQGL